MGRRKGKHSRSFPEVRILEMILSGELTVKHINSSDPVIVHRGVERKTYICNGRRNKRHAIKIHSHYEGGIRYIRTVMRAKLVWMIVHHKLVPEGHVIHHKDENRFNDSKHNLVCSSEYEHNAYHYGEPDF